MLTGLEQYYLERAGYFIRRQVDFPEGLLAQGREAALQRMADEATGAGDVPLTRDTRPLYALLGDPAMMEMLRGALGPALRLTGAALLFSEAQAWSRTFGPPLDAPDGEQRTALARFQHGLCLHLPFHEEVRMFVLPASHLEPLGQEEREAVQADLFATLPGQVRIRLQPGDVFVYNANLLRRTGKAPKQSRCALTFTVVSPAQPASGTTAPSSPDPGLLSELPSSLQALFGR